MRLATRLWWHGAALPAALLTATLLLVGVGLDRALVHAVDDALSSQAAVESVSVFDQGIDGPHLHVDRSELARSLGEAPASTALYGGDGRRMRVWPGDATLPDHLDTPVAEPMVPTLRTVRHEGSSARELVLQVVGPDGGAYHLLLRRSLAERDAAMGAYAAVSMFSLLLVVLALGLSARSQVRGLDSRVRALVEHVERVGGGADDAAPPPDTVGDEISALRDAVAQSTAARARAKRAEARLLADAAHELRTPLAAMRLEIDLALRRGRGADADRQTLESVAEEVDRLTRIAESLLQLETPGGTQRAATTALSDIVKRSVARAKRVAAARGISVEVSAERSATLRADRDALERALDNLLDNALRFAASTVRCALRPERGGWAIVVSDDGPGVPPADAEAIFAAFHRRDRSGPGAGLGLTIVRDVANAHGGTITLRATSAGGAEFALWLPDNAAPAGDLAAPAPGP